MIGLKFGKLTVTKRTDNYINPSSNKPSRRWLCLCECGGPTTNALKSGNTTSCGCSRLSKISKLNKTQGYKKV